MKSTLIVVTLFSLALVGALALGFVSTSDKSNNVTEAAEPAAQINYEVLAANIDRGLVGAYENKHLRVRGYICGFLDLPSGKAIAFGEKSHSSGDYPTILCSLSNFDTKAAEFRGKEAESSGIYSSAFPDRLVTVAMLFTGRMSSQIEVYGGKNCKVE